MTTEERWVWQATPVQQQQQTAADAPPADDPPADPPPGDEPPADPPAGGGNQDDPPADPPPGDGNEPPNLLEVVPDNWREQLAGDDQAKLNQLKRIPDFGTFANNYFSAQEKIRTGQIAAIEPPGDDATEEEVKAYRETFGIPESPEAYDEHIQLEEGVAFGDEDKPILNAVYEAAHANNVPASQISTLANAMLKGREQQFQQMEMQQEEYRKEAVNALKETWKGDYETNVSLIRGTILENLPESVREDFENAILPNGRKLFNTPEVLVAMADWSRKLNPAATVVPNSGNPMQSIDTEIEKYRTMMKDEPEKWYADQAAQKHYRELLAAKENLDRQ